MEKLLFIASVGLMNNKEVHHLQSSPSHTNIDTDTFYVLALESILFCSYHFLINIHGSLTVIEYSFLSGRGGAWPGLGRSSVGMWNARAGVVS